jgi:PAS domain S-box-containing protein
MDKTYETHLLERRVEQRTAELVAANALLKDEVSERKQVEEALRQADKKYHSIFENLLEGIFQTTPNGRFISANPAMARMLGYESPEELIADCPDIAHRHYVEHEGHDEFKRLVVEHGVVQGFELQVYRKDGTKIWTSGNVRVVCDVSGTPLYYEGNVEDITERKQAEEALRETNQTLQTLIQASPLAIVGLDANWNVKMWNPAAERMFGWSEQEILGGPLPFVSEANQNEFRDFRELVLQGDVFTDVEICRRKKDGSPIDISLSTAPLRDAEGKIIGIMSIMVDIADRKRAEQALKQSERDYRELFEQAHDAILIFTPEREIVLDVNHRACEIYGFSRSEFLGMSLEAISRDIPRGRLRVEETLKQEGNLNFEAVQYRKDGTEMFLEINAAVIDYKNQQAILSVNRDVTERKREEEERGQLLARLVTAQEEEQRRLSRELHDQMGQSLAALTLGLKSLVDSGQFHLSAQDRLQQAQEVANQLAQQVHTLASDLRPAALDDLGLQAALSNFVEEWSERCTIAADLHTNGLIKQRLPSHIETTVYRIVREALANVLKHAKAQNVSIIVEHRGNRVLVIVEDDGAGFDAEAMIAKPMRERRLGLLGIQERVALVNGKLNIESRPGAGTTVLVHIPVSPDQLEGDAR